MAEATLCPQRIREVLVCFGTADLALLRQELEKRLAERSDVEAAEAVAN